MRLLAALLLLFSSLFAQEILYVIHAKEATFEPKKQILTLMNTDLSVTYFSHEEPKRAGKITTESFISDLVGMDKQFKAGLIFFEEEDEFYSNTPVVLSDPLFNLQTQNLSFKARLEDHKGHLPEKMVEATLYVDLYQSGLAFEGVDEDPIRGFLQEGH